MATAVLQVPYGIGSAPRRCWVPTSNDEDPKPVPEMSGDVLRDIVAAAHQVEDTMVAAFLAA